MEIIDAFCHWLPPAYYEEACRTASIPLHMFHQARRIPEMSDRAARDRFVDEVSGYRQILSLVSPPVEALAGPDHSPRLARLANQGLAALVREDPRRYPSFVGALPLNNEDATREELDYATHELGAAGFQVFTHVNGAPLDQAGVIERVLEWCVPRAQPVWLHPFRGFNHPDYLSQVDSFYEIWWSLGWLYETSAALLHLAYGGVFDRWPGLKLITHHAGAMIPFAEGRLRTGVRKPGLRLPEDRQDLFPVRSTRSVIDSLKHCYADTATFGTDEAILAACRFFGPDQVLFATDAPFGPEGGRGHRAAAIDAIRRLPLEPGQPEGLFSANLHALLPRLQDR